MATTPEQPGSQPQEEHVSVAPAETQGAGEFTIADLEQELGFELPDFSIEDLERDLGFELPDFAEPAPAPEADDEPEAPMMGAEPAEESPVETAEPVMEAPAEVEPVIETPAPEADDEPEAPMMGAEPEVVPEEAATEAEPATAESIDEPQAEVEAPVDDAEEDAPEADAESAHEQEISEPAIARVGPVSKFIAKTLRRVSDGLDSLDDVRGGKAGKFFTASMAAEDAAAVLEHVDRPLTSEELQERATLVEEVAKLQEEFAGLGTDSHDPKFIENRTKYFAATHRLDQIANRVSK